MATAAEFFDCKNNLAAIFNDAEALDVIITAHTELKKKFSSGCLEFLLKQNFMETVDYLLDNYYPGTSIDTEIIVRSVANDVQRN